MEELYQLNLAGGETMYISVPPTETIKELKQRLKETIGVEIEFNSLNDNPVDENSNAASYFSQNNQLPSLPGGGLEATVALDADGGVNLSLVEVPSTTEGENTTLLNEDAMVLKVGGDLDGDLLGTFCSVPGCSSNLLETPNVQFHEFPTNKKRFNEWLKIIKRAELAAIPAELINNQHSVCSLHFSPIQYTGNMKKLKVTAVPDIMLNESMVEDEELPNAESEGEIEEESPTYQPHQASSDHPSTTEEETPVTNNDDYVNDATAVEIKEEFDCDEAELFEALANSHPGSLCRLCAEPVGESPHFLFKDSNLADIINGCLPIYISQTDVLPKQVCGVCHQRVMLQNSFADACMEAEKKLIALTQCFIVNGLTKPVFKNERGELVAKKNVYCCPLCCQGGMEKKKNEDADVTFAEAREEIDDIEDEFVPMSDDEVEEEDEPVSLADLPELGDEESAEVVLDRSRSALNLVYLPDDRNFSCECAVCEEIFPTSLDCLEHCKTHSAVDYFPCMICGLVFPMEGLLEQHFIQHKAKAANLPSKRWKTVLSCGTCKIQVNTRKSFILHECKNPVLGIKNVDLESTVSCHPCKRTFSSEARATLHKQNHPDYMEERVVLQCSFCHIQMDTEKMLGHHIEVAHEGPEHRCEDCGLRFITADHLTTHSKVHQPNIYQYQCTVCEKMFHSLDSVHKHVKMHYKQNEGKDFFPCNKCGKSFPLRGQLQYHLETTHDTMGKMPSMIQYKCKICAEIICSSAEVVSHRTVHWQVTDPAFPYICEYCGEPNPSPTCLARHRRYLHLDEQPYLCTLCSKTTRTLYEARVHRKTHTAPLKKPAKAKPKVFQCDQCPLLFAHKSAFLYHKKTHKVVKWYKCDSCDKEFSERHRLVVHRRLHTGEKPYACGTCGKRFAQTSSMYSHAMKHTGETPYSCDLCERRFRLKSDRDSHRRTHTGEKPYKCQWCGKCFRTGQVYYQHRMIHTGERRFPCDVCGRAFKRSHTLVCHKRIHSGEKPNVCEICFKGFRQRTDMRKHKMNVHQISS